MEIPTQGAPIAPSTPTPPHDASVKDVAAKLESAFIAEMLKASGVGKTPESFGGGAGEDQFSSFLREAQAREITRAGGLGLAAHFERALRG